MSEPWIADEILSLRAEVERLRAALNAIASMCPATAEITVAHRMAVYAMCTLEPKDTE